MDAKTHWENIYTTKAPTEVSWYQDHPRAWNYRANISRCGMIARCFIF